MVQQRKLFLSTGNIEIASRPVSPILCIPIRLEWDQGKVVTETTTEFQEVTDDSDFGNFGSGSSLGSNFDSSWKKLDSGSPKQALSPGSPRPTLTSGAKSKSSSSSDDDDEDDEKFAKEALETHNEYRAKHGVKPLKLDKKLSKYAQEWADTLAKEDRFDHRPDQTYGENIYCTWTSGPKATCNPRRPVESWYSEVTKYNFDKPSGNSMGAGHFTQVVWKESERLGMGKAKSKSGKIIVVANYDPPGNFIGQYADNVLKPK